jgi:hypothetical protein
MKHATCASWEFPTWRANQCFACYLICTTAFVQLLFLSWDQFFLDGRTASDSLLGKIGRGSKAYDIACPYKATFLLELKGRLAQKFSQDLCRVYTDCRSAWRCLAICFSLIQISDIPATHDDSFTQGYDTRSILPFFESLPSTPASCNGVPPTTTLSHIQPLVHQSRRYGGPLLLLALNEPKPNEANHSEYDIPTQFLIINRPLLAPRLSRNSSTFKFSYRQTVA